MYQIKAFVYALFIYLSCIDTFIEGRIVRVADGDTVIILTEDKQQVRIRLADIDCPEKSQDFDNKATLLVRELCYNKEAKVIKTGTDRYGRTLGVLYVDSINVNEVLVRQGLAWHYKRYTDCHRLDSLEKIARKEKLNIWSLPNPIPPWVYRKTLKNERF